VEDIEHTLSEMKRLDPDNLTVHSLALKTAARLRLEWDKYENLDFVNSTQIMDEALQTGRDMDMHPYYLYRQKNMAGNLENVGMSKPGRDGIYNVLIMEEREDIVAIGAGAASKRVRPDGNGGWQISRCENVKDIRTYIDRLDEMISRKDLLFTESML
ncbi:MAG: coproporphyrinogen dehydrogenase HemZ, partial [Lachnospiraceae bacterium]|nr:coproporphyrinogen dehydrogenase HemZ [Lachnospiraceae bacterium]MDY2760048.1 coproporphyrinogen dehydrogenase HemZ [Lachnospiraceae bacterium]